jgi:transposase
MFIRKVTQKNSDTKKIYNTYRLVEGYRNSQGKVRQQLILNLGANFSIPKKDWKLLADRIEELLSGQESLLTLERMLEKQAQNYAKLARHKYAGLNESRVQPKTSAPDQPDYHSVDVNSLEHCEVRHIGAEALGVQAAAQLKLEPLLKKLGFNPKKCHLAMASIIGRLVSPGSETSTHHYLTDQSALDELLGTSFSDLSHKNFYKIADDLLKHKTEIETALFKREKTLFSLNQIITLYDITNTYFEGRALQNIKAQHGRSKEKRSDCPLVSMGLVLDSSGFPQKSEIFPGNVSEPKTLAQMLEQLEAKKDATIVMDAGFASEENVLWLQENNYHYIVVSRQATPILDDNAEKVLVKEARNNKVEATLIRYDDKQEVVLYCHSQAKEEKSRLMQTKAESRFEEELQKLLSGLSKKTGTKKPDKINERIGRLKERHKRIASRYTIDVTAENNKVIHISWAKKSTENKLGVYCLRSNRLDLGEKELWKLYTTLTEVEAAFRSLKTELGFRPVYHQKDKRVDAHLFISLLAYHLLHTIRYQLKLHNIDSSWQTLRQLFDTQMRITSTMVLENGKTLSIRKTTKATPEQLVVYQALGIDSKPGKTEKIIF